MHQCLLQDDNLNTLCNAHVIRCTIIFMMKRLTLEKYKFKKWGCSHKKLLFKVAENLNTDVNHLCKMALGRCFWFYELVSMNCAYVNGSKCIWEDAGLDLYIKQPFASCPMQTLSVNGNLLIQPHDDSIAPKRHKKITKLKQWEQKINME